MIRNKEFRYLLLILGMISVIGCVGGLFFSIKVSLFVLSVSTLFSTATLLFTRWRYREIAKLSTYLREISSGNFSLDVRDNDEGELSILKNDIYKVTTLLSEHSALLEEDKHKLTNAISDISHQLKTPLTSMKMMADLLNDPELPSEQRKQFTQTIRIQLERIEWLVSALLTLSKIDAGTVTFNKEKISVKQLIDDAMQTVLIPIEIKQQIIHFHSDQDITCVADFKWTTEAIINILKNCVEHTPQKGTIDISFSTNDLFSEIIMADNGGGILKEDLPFIFQRFYRGKNSTDDSVGIGLPLAYTIISEQGGDLSVESKINQGTSFIIKFYHN